MLFAHWGNLLSLFRQKFPGILGGSDFPPPRDPIEHARRMYQRGESELALGRHKKAVRELTWARANLAKYLGEHHRETLKALHSLACAYMELGVLDAAIPMLEEAFHNQRFYLGATHGETLTSMASLGKAYLDGSRFFLAETYLRNCLVIAIQEDVYSGFIACVQSMLGASLLRQNKRSEGENLLKQGYEELKLHQTRSKLRRLMPVVIGTTDRIGSLLESMDRKSTAARWKALSPGSS